MPREMKNKCKRRVAKTITGVQESDNTNKLKSTTERWKKLEGLIVLERV
jgi:hypothetical protein